MVFPMASSPSSLLLVAVGAPVNEVPLGVQVAEANRTVAVEVGAWTCVVFVLLLLHPAPWHAW